MQWGGRWGEEGLGRRREPGHDFLHCTLYLDGGFSGLFRRGYWYMHDEISGMSASYIYVRMTRPNSFKDEH